MIATNGQITRSALLAFEHKTRVILISSIIPLNTIKKDIKKTIKYEQIKSSIESVGLVELPVVFSNTKKRDTYFLLDGLLRLEVLKDLGEKEVECLIATDDEAYTYNKHINRLAPVQEHLMVVRAVERGASLERIAHALNLDKASIEHRFRLTRGICPEAVRLMEDKQCPMVVFDLLKKMQPMRQIEAVELMIGQANYSYPFAKAILAASSSDQLLKSRRRKTEVNEITRDQIARLERELAMTQQRTRCVEETYGVDNLTLTVTKTYLVKLLSRPRIVKWLSLRRADFLAEFQSIAEISSLNRTETISPNEQIQ